MNDDDSSIFKGEVGEVYDEGRKMKKTLTNNLRVSTRSFMTTTDRVNS